MRKEAKDYDKYVAGVYTFFYKINFYKKMSLKPPPKTLKNVKNNSSLKYLGCKFWKHWFSLELSKVTKLTLFLHFSNLKFFSVFIINGSAILC